MNGSAHSEFGASFNSLARMAGGIVLVAGLAMLFGWLAGFAAVKAPLPYGGNMKANAALCFVLAGIALRSAAAPYQRSRRVLLPLCALLLLAIGGATLAEQVFGINLGIDELLAADPLGNPPGRMVSLAAVAFTLVGVALLLLGIRIVAAQLAALGILAAGALGLLGYLFGAHPVWGIEAQVAMAPTTAVLFLILSAGLLCVKPEGGLMKILPRPCSAERPPAG